MATALLVAIQLQVVSQEIPRLLRTQSQSGIAPSILLVTKGTTPTKPNEKRLFLHSHWGPCPTRSKLTRALFMVPSIPLALGIACLGVHDYPWPSERIVCSVVFVRVPCFVVPHGNQQNNHHFGGPCFVFQMKINRQTTMLGPRKKKYPHKVVIYIPFKLNGRMGPFRKTSPREGYLPRACFYISASGRETVGCQAETQESSKLGSIRVCLPELKSEYPRQLLVAAAPTLPLPRI